MRGATDTNLRLRGVNPAPKLSDHLRSLKDVSHWKFRRATFK